MDRIDANLYLNLIRGGAAALAAHRQTVNDLNVFPIPDGDTGDNMFMTIQAGCHAAGSSLPEMAKAVLEFRYPRNLFYRMGVLYLCDTAKRKRLIDIIVLYSTRRNPKSLK